MTTTKTLLAAILAVAALATTATAANPVKGATYKGKVAATTGDPRVKLKVSSTGKRLTFVLSCFGSEAVRIKRVKITDGKFQAYKPSFTAKGHFATRKKAKGTISGNACFLPSGASFRATKS